MGEKLKGFVEPIRPDPLEDLYTLANFRLAQWRDELRREKAEEHLRAQEIGREIFGAVDFAEILRISKAMDCSRMQDE